MKEILLTFAVAFVFSFVGTIPPGTMNLTAVQLGIEKRVHIAWRMAIAAAVIEYPYAWIAVGFQDYLSRSIEFTHQFHLLSAAVMISLGIFSLWSAARPSRFSKRFEKSGFRRGILLGLLNPLAIPFWLGMTAYLRSYGWVDLSDAAELHAYLAGISLGTIALLMLFAYTAGKIADYFAADSLLKRIPGVVLVVLGLYSLGKYILG